MQQLINEALFPFVSSALTGFVTWFFTRKKQKAEIATNELENVEKAISIWRNMSEDLKKQLVEQGKEIHELRNEVQELRAENKKLYDELKKWKRQSKPNEGN